MQRQTTSQRAADHHISIEVFSCCPIYTYMGRKYFYEIPKISNFATICNEMQHIATLTMVYACGMIFSSRGWRMPPLFFLNKSGKQNNTLRLQPEIKKVMTLPCLTCVQHSKGSVYSDCTFKKCFLKGGPSVFLSCSSE